MNSFAPIGIFRCRIEQPPIGAMMAFVILGYVRRVGGLDVQEIPPGPEGLEAADVFAVLVLTHADPPAETGGGEDESIDPFVIAPPRGVMDV